MDIEEKLNSISHGIAAIFSIFGFSLLIKYSLQSNKDWTIFSSIIYGISLTLVYTSSTLYHLIQKKKLKHIFRILDHCSIFLLIAGTYTPVLLVLISGSIGWWFFGIQWLFVLIGIYFKIYYTGKYETLSILLYLLMGWMVVFKWDILTGVISNSAFTLLLGGGIAYSIGIVFYLFDTKIKYFHFIWHLFVITGSLLHYIMILKYVIN